MHTLTSSGAARLVLLAIGLFLGLALSARSETTLYGSIRCGLDYLDPDADTKFEKIEQSQFANPYGSSSFSALNYDTPELSASGSQSALGTPTFSYPTVLDQFGMEISAGLNLYGSQTLPEAIQDVW